MVDPAGNQAIHTYDALGRLISVNQIGKNNGTRNHAYQYDWFGNLISQSHPETGSIVYQYDLSGKTVQENWGSSIKKYFYADGRLIRVETSKPNYFEGIYYNYDDKARLILINNTKGWRRKNIAYNIRGSITQETWSIPGLPDSTIEYFYDSENRLASIKYPSGRVSNTSYNDLGLPFSLYFKNDTIINSISYQKPGLPEIISFAKNGTVYSATYKSTGHLIEESLKKGGTTLYGSSYQYDDVGNITGINISGTYPISALQATFTYDQIYRLTQATYTAGRVNTYAHEYDDFGNMLKVYENGSKVFEKSYNGNNQITGFSYDDHGNLINANGRQYFWDGLNRLQWIQSSSGEILGQYMYDDRGLRIKALPPLPVIRINVGDKSISSGDTVNFYAVGNNEEKEFTVLNQGHLNLNLGNISISGANASLFQITKQPDSVVYPGGSTTFKIKF